MTQRAPSSGIRVNRYDAATIKGMLYRGDRQHDIASWFGVNGGRIAEIATGARFREVQPALPITLPPPGPYMPGRDVAILLQALVEARSALDDAESFIRRP